jgi:hypothetical protein
MQEVCLLWLSSCLGEQLKTFRPVVQSARSCSAHMAQGRRVTFLLSSAAMEPSMAATRLHSSHPVHGILIAVPVVRLNPASKTNQ